MTNGKSFISVFWRAVVIVVGSISASDELAADDPCEKLRQQLQGARIMASTSRSLLRGYEQELRHAEQMYRREPDKQRYYSDQIDRLSFSVTSNREALDRHEQLVSEIARDLAECEQRAGQPANQVGAGAGRVAAGPQAPEPLRRDDITRLGPADAMAMATHQGDLHLNGLTALSSLTARYLATGHVGAIFLNRLKSVSAEEADALAKNKGDLHLNGLSSLSRSAAHFLSRHEGDLYLNGLTTLSTDAAKRLAAHGGKCELKGLQALSDEAAAALRANPQITLPDKFKQ